MLDFIYLLVGVVLQIEPRALHILFKGSTTELCSQPSIFLSFFIFYLFIFFILLCWRLNPELVHGRQVLYHCATSLVLLLFYFETGSC
jgi:hypothetical protein